MVEHNDGKMVLPILGNNSSGATSNDSNEGSPQNRMESIASLKYPRDLNNRLKRHQSISKRANTRLLSADQFDNMYSRRESSSTTNSCNVSRKSSFISHSLRQPSEDDFGIDGSLDSYSNPIIAFPHIRNLVTQSTKVASRPYSPERNARSRQGSILEIGCLRKVESIKGRADQRTVKQDQAKITRQNITESEIRSKCQGIQDREKRTLKKAFLKDNEIRRKFWLKVIKISAVLIQIPSKLPMQADTMRRIKAIRVIFGLFLLYKMKKRRQQLKSWLEKTSLLSMAANSGILCMVSTSIHSLEE